MACVIAGYFQLRRSFPSGVDRMNKQPTLVLWLLLLGALSATGCQSMAWPAMWPFPDRERTTHEGPRQRIEAIEQLASQSDGTDSPKQREIVEQLARQIQKEPDPLVRAAIVQTVVEYRVPLALQVLEAGLGDTDGMVRTACCRALGKRADTTSVARLGQVLRNDKKQDVRMAAADALGKIKTNESMQALVAAVEDRDPAMQYVGIQAMKSVSGKDYGGDIAAWKQLAGGGEPPLPPAPSIAERIRSVSPY
jgi:HEAT repeat protein